MIYWCVNWNIRGFGKVSISVNMLIYPYFLNWIDPRLLNCPKTELDNVSVSVNMLNNRYFVTVIDQALSNDPKIAFDNVSISVNILI